MPGSIEDEDIVSIEGLSITYKTVYGNLVALNSVDLRVKRGESVSIVGESGCGKSTLGHAIVRLLPLNASYSTGKITLAGKDVAHLSGREMNSVRGSSAFMIFQDPLNSLNPVKRVDVQMLEAVRSRQKHEGKPFNENEARREAVQKLDEIRMPDPDKIITRYPYQLSGGQIQRVVISMGLMMRPKLMIADEPTTALDVTIQAQVLDLMRELQHEYGMSIIFITHDINVAHTISDRMVVMYAGEIIEMAPTTRLVKAPLHPYSQALIASIPMTNKAQGKLNAIVGAPPDMFSPPTGCRFHPRCPFIMPICSQSSPRSTAKDESEVRCFLYG